MNTSPISASPTVDPAKIDTVEIDTVESAPLVGNPRRIRGLHRSMLDRPAPVSNMLGNPRRLRKLDAAAFAA